MLTQREFQLIHLTIIKPPGSFLRIGNPPSLHPADTVLCNIILVSEVLDCARSVRADGVYIPGDLENHSRYNGASQQRSVFYDFPVILVHHQRRGNQVRKEEFYWTLSWPQVAGP